MFGGTVRVCIIRRTVDACIIKKGVCTCYKMAINLPSNKVLSNEIRNGP